MRSSKKGFKISFVISSIVLFSVLSTLLINSIVGYQAEKSSLYNTTLELNRIHSDEMSKTTQTIILSMKQTVRATAQYFTKENSSDEAAQKQLDFLMSTDNMFNSVALVDKTGLVRAVSPGNLDIVGQKLTSQASRQALELQKPLMSEPYKAITNRLIILVSHPVFDLNGNYNGFISGTIYLQEPNSLKKILGEQPEANNGSYYYVVDATGNIIYHPDPERIGDNVITNPVIQKIVAGGSGQGEVTNTKGVHFLAGYSIVPETGWGIVAQTPKDYVDQSTERLITWMALYSLPFLIIVFALVLWLSHKLSQPLSRLAHIASRLNNVDGMNKEIPNIDHWNYEANELYKAIAKAFHIMNKRTEELSFEAQTDPLTGLTNRRTMDAILGLWQEQSKSFSIIMLDLDHFKLVNDTYGHQVGDQVLQFTAGIMQSEKREQDYCCRYGGEEFTMLLPDATAEQAFLLAERIRTRIESTNCPTGKIITLSLGVASYPNPALDIHRLFKNADDALYQAKHNGRNQTVVYMNESEPKVLS
ncbi:diguanylate cyclase (GGDEF) domain-containing protein [Paenibacillus sp. 1_12]|uniref:sensor domain-containing diguanylate cyclase n=1 Tax=Paenibacillus sp. 1_12 TaxID=1566278 RepID=UPI0008E1C739|nr:sensor domain-containing diguanylate cyclase [Paenibacillus sp. 1_12]SFK94354.1 diguanylate cyclase (GGDEF) domain-containing protein [Paenibacillus sp. 1_12]